MDKPSCDNCGVPPCSIYKMYNRDTTVCEKWRRDPHKWLDILPEEEEVLKNLYCAFWWEADIYSLPIIVRVKPNHRPLIVESVWDGRVIRREVKKMGGRWQGPIRPEGEK
jgi:hypothetical protein